MKRFLTIVAVLLAVTAAIQAVGFFDNSNSAEASQGGGVGGGGSPGV